MDRSIPTTPTDGRYNAEQVLSAAEYMDTLPPLQVVREKVSKIKEKSKTVDDLEPAEKTTSADDWSTNDLTAPEEQTNDLSATACYSDDSPPLRVIIRNFSKSRSDQLIRTPTPPTAATSSDFHPDEQDEELDNSPQVAYTDDYQIACYQNPDPSVIINSSKTIHIIDETKEIPEKFSLSGTLPGFSGGGELKSTNFVTTSIIQKYCSFSPTRRSPDIQSSPLKSPSSIIRDVSESTTPSTPMDNLSAEIRGLKNGFQLLMFVSKGMGTIMLSLVAQLVPLIGRYILTSLFCCACIPFYVILHAFLFILGLLGISL